MIRRDYILRMIEEWVQVLLRVVALKKDHRWQDAAEAVDEEFHRLVGTGARVVSQLSEAELLAKLIQGEPPLVVRYKALLLTALLNEAGDLAAAQHQALESRSCYLKGLHLLLDTRASREISEYPDYVPRVEVFVASLQDTPLPIRTQALLMEHYEQTGQFAKAEDALFALLEVEPDSVEILDFGVAFYERLNQQNDAALQAGNLPRPELEAGLGEVRARRAALT